MRMIRSHQQPRQIRQVAIFGGTHGNEITGIRLAEKFLKSPQLIERPSLNTHVYLANLQAIRQNIRYVEQDLNRQFLLEDLNNPHLKGYEELLAKSIYRDLQQNQTDLVIDLHSTTAAMGLTLILSQADPWLFHLAAYLTAINPLVKVVLPLPSENSHRLRNSCDLGLTVEVGAIAHGTFDAGWMEQTETLIHNILDYLEYWNNNQTIDYPETFSLFSSFEAVKYPRNSLGEICATVHPQLLAQDYLPLEPHSPLFLSLDHTTVTFYLGNHSVYPIFIAEASYLEKDIAMILTKKQKITLSDNLVPFSK